MRSWSAQGITENAVSASFITSKLASRLIINRPDNQLSNDMNINERKVIVLCESLFIVRSDS
jgi:hypothetical protein